MSTQNSAFDQRPEITRITLTAAILAGGRARRMDGRDKGLLPLAQRPMIGHVIDRIKPQVDRIVINANRNLSEYEALGWPVVTDANDRYQGPLAGMLSALRYADSEFVLTAPCDCPLIVTDYAARMVNALGADDARLCVASDGDRIQPVFALIHVTLAADLQAFLDGEGRKIDRWFERHPIKVVNFGDATEMFRNINTPEDLAELELTVFGQEPNA